MEEVNPVKRNIEESVDPSKKLKLDQQIRATKVVQENEVGITQFINEANRTGGGFFGTIKQRYSDFLVNEIDPNGEVVRLLDEGINLGKTRKEKKLLIKLSLHHYFIYRFKFLFLIVIHFNKVYM